MKLKSHWWWDLSTQDFSELDAARIVAIVPIGAVEQHGPHLPVKVDAAICAAVVARAVAMMPADMPALVLPLMPIGKSDEHLSFPGTLTLSYETLGRVWYEIGESVSRVGIRKILFLNAHGGQPQLSEIVCRELRVKLGLFAVSAMWSRMVDLTDLFDPAEIRHGIHGGECETSIMLHLHPDLVAMERAENFASLSIQLERENELLTPEGKISFGWQSQDLHAKGACGNAAAADADRGRVALDLAAGRLLTLIEEIEHYPLSRLAARGAFHR